MRISMCLLDVFVVRTSAASSSLLNLVFLKLSAIIWLPNVMMWPLPSADLMLCVACMKNLFELSNFCMLCMRVRLFGMFSVEINTLNFCLFVFVVVLFDV